MLPYLLAAHLVVRAVPGNDLIPAKNALIKYPNDPGEEIEPRGHYSPPSPESTSGGTRAGRH